MIAVRIPKEIRAYKEKLLFGLTVRQIIFSAIAVGICIPLYIWGKKIMPEDVVSWIVMIVALPSGAFGFVKINGMAFENYLAAIVKNNFLFPAKRKNKYYNCFRHWQEITIKEDFTRAKLGSAKAQKKLKDESLLNAYRLMQELENKLSAEIIRENENV